LERCRQILQGVVATAYGAPAQHAAEGASGLGSPFLALEPSPALREQFERRVVIILRAGERSNVEWPAS